ncbi:MAG: hypothetical protein ACJ8C4_04785 [Gemmataceae bacterium]
MRSFLFASTVLLFSAASASAQVFYVPSYGYYSYGCAAYPWAAVPVVPLGGSAYYGPRDFLWEVPPPAIRHVIVTKPVPVAPAKLLVNAPKNVEVRYAGQKLTFENGVSVIELPQMEKQTTINLVVHTAKKDVTVPVVVTPGSTPSVRILG